MINFIKDLVRNEFGSTVAIYRSQKVRMQHVIFIWSIFFIVAIITTPISISRHSKSKIDIEQVYYEEYPDFCMITYAYENRNASFLSNFTLQYEVKDKNTGKIICSDKKVVWESDNFLISFNTIQTDEDGTEHATQYSDMIIEYKIIEANFADGAFLDLAKYISLGVALIPFYYYVGKFFIIIFPIVLYVHTFNIKNFFLRNLIRLLFLLPYLLGGVWFGFGHPDEGGGLKNLRVAVDANGNRIGLYNPDTHVVEDMAGRVIVPITKNKK